MLTHVVLFTLNNRDDADEILSRLRDLRSQIPSLISLRCGKNSIAKPNSWDIALVTEHADADGFYRNTPLTLFTWSWSRWLASRLASRAVVDSIDFE